MRAAESEIRVSASEGTGRAGHAGGGKRNPREPVRRKRKKAHAGGGKRNPREPVRRKRKKAHAGGGKRNPRELVRRNRHAAGGKQAGRLRKERRNDI